MSAADDGKRAPEVIDLTGLSLGELRDARHRLELEEQELSFVRRVLQGRIDILRAEQLRRTGDGSDVLPSLAEILSDQPSASRAPGAYPHMQIGDPVRSNPIAVAADRAASDVGAADLSELTDDALAGAVADLQRHERSVSQARSQLHGRLDRMGGELTRRYRDGSAQVDDLLAAARRR